MAEPIKKKKRRPAPIVEVAAPGAELEESRMPFMSHLGELRDRVRNAAICFAVAFGVCYYFADRIYAWLRAPLFEVWATKPALAHEAPQMTFSSLTEPFWVNLSVSMWAGVFVASPFIFYQIWRFIAPGLYKKERRVTVGFAISSAVFFVGGAMFCYYLVLGRLYDFLLGYATADTKPAVMLEGYLDLTRDMMLAFGAIFELPLVILFLAMVGLVTHRGLWKFNRWFIVIAFVVGAILTPSPDAVSQIFMATPMVVLYNLSIVLAWSVTRKREKAAAERAERERIADEKERAERKVRKAAKAAATAERAAAAAAALTALPSAPPDDDPRS